MWHTVYHRQVVLGGHYTEWGYNAQYMKTVVNRLKRLEGQLARVRADIEAAEKCDKVIPQLLAVKGAMNATVEEYLLSSIKGCADSKCSPDVAKLLETVIKKV